jgi:hypothetical protein
LIEEGGFAGIGSSGDGDEPGLVDWSHGVGACA